MRITMFDPKLQQYPIRNIINQLNKRLMELDHFLYPRAQKDKADAVAWVIADQKARLQMYPFTFPDIGETEIRVKILYTSICQSDILTVRGKWGDCNYPNCPGHQMLGEVTLVGSAVTKRKVGQRVGCCPLRFSCLSCEYCKKGQANLCIQRVFLYDQGYFGGFCTHVQLDQNWAFPLPQNLDLEVSAPVLCAGVTVYAPLKRHGKPGKTCAIIGIGGLGHLAIQYAHKLGMTVTAFTTKTQTPEPYKKMGASFVQHSTDLQQLKKNMGKYDIVLNTLFLQDEMIYLSHQRLTAPCGTYINVGLPDNKTKFKIDSGYATRNQIIIAGSLVGSMDEVQDCINFSANYSVKPIVQTYDFGEFDKALDRAQQGNPKFRVVIKVIQWAKKHGFDK